MAAVETVTHHNEEQADDRKVYRVHFLSCADESRCDYIEVVAYQIDAVDTRTINADGVMIQFQNDMTEVTAV